MTPEANYSRLQPSLPTSPLITLRSCPAGFGVFALQDIPKGTTVLEANSPDVSVIYEDIKQETCAWCFKYNAEEDLRIGIEACPGLSFCCEDCKASWRNKYGDEGLEAYTVANKFLRSDHWLENASSDADTSLASTEEISQELFNEAWAAAEAQAELIYAYRCAPEDDKASLHPDTVRVQEEASENAMKMEQGILDAEIMMFILDSLLLPNPEWEKVKTLNSMQRKRTIDMLNRGTRAFLRLHCILPVSVLKKGRLTRATVERLIGADDMNSFEIRHYADQDAPTEFPDIVGQGYAMWLDASFFNHACGNNVARMREGRKWIFKTERDVLKGEELCITYVQSFTKDGTTLEDRRMLLKSWWGFECRCAKCLEEAGEVESTA